MWSEDGVGWCWITLIVGRFQWLLIGCVRNSACTPKNSVQALRRLRNHDSHCCKRPFKRRRETLRHALENHEVKLTSLYRGFCSVMGHICFGRRYTDTPTDTIGLDRFIFFCCVPDCFGTLMYLLFTCHVCILFLVSFPVYNGSSTCTSTNNWTQKVQKMALNFFVATSSNLTVCECLLRKSPFL